MTRPTNEQHGVQVLEDAFRRWAKAPPARVEMDRCDGWLAMSMLQLATRHPDISPQIREAAERVGRRIQDEVCDSADLFNIAETGWNPDHDIDPAPHRTGLWVEGDLMVFDPSELSGDQQAGDACVICSKKWPRPQAVVGMVPDGRKVRACADCVSHRTEDR